MDVTQFRLNEVDWIVVGDGVYLAPLHQIEEGAGTAFLRFDAGSTSSSHQHPAGEELFVVSGRLRVGDRTLEAGDFLYTPPGEVHAVTAIKDSVALISVPEPLQFL